MLEELSKKEKQIMFDKIEDVFTGLLKTCNIIDYNFAIQDDLENKDEYKTLGVEVSYPYRFITLWVRSGIVSYYKEKNWDVIKRIMFHEIFHILTWEMREIALKRWATEEQFSNAEESAAEKFSIFMERLTI